MQGTDNKEILDRPSQGHSEKTRRWGVWGGEDACRPKTRIELRSRLGKKRRFISTCLDLTKGIDKTKLVTVHPSTCCASIDQEVTHYIEDVGRKLRKGWNENV